MSDTPAATDPVAAPEPEAIPAAAPEAAPEPEATPAPEPADPLAVAEAEVEHAAADLAAAVEPSTEELLANAPPLVLPEGTNIIKHCPGCDLALMDPPAGLICPNCGTTIP